MYNQLFSLSLPVLYARKQVSELFVRFAYVGECSYSGPGLTVFRSASVDSLRKFTLYVIKT